MKKITAWFFWFAGAMLMAWLGNYFYDSTKDVPVLKYITGALNWIFDAGQIVLNYQIKVWIILVVLAVLIGVLALYAKFSNTPTKEPDFTKYKKDIFKSWIWRWDWKPGPNGWQIINLTPYCPKDDVQLIQCGSFLNKEYYCPKCNTQFNEWREPLEYHADAQVLILDKVNKQTFSKTD